MSIPQGFPSRSRFLQGKNFSIVNLIILVNFIVNPENQTEIQETLYNVTKEGEKNSPDESFERSAALERVYVHEVYENLDDYNTSSTVRSKILQFLNNLDPGSIIWYLHLTLTRFEHFFDFLIFLKRCWMRQWAIFKIIQSFNFIFYWSRAKFPPSKVCKKFCCRSLCGSKAYDKFF